MQRRGRQSRGRLPSCDMEWPGPDATEGPASEFSESVAQMLRERAEERRAEERRRWEKACQRARGTEDEAMEVCDAPEDEAPIRHQLATPERPAPPPAVDPPAPTAVKRSGGTARRALRWSPGNRGAADPSPAPAPVADSPESPPPASRGPRPTSANGARSHDPPGGARSEEAKERGAGVDLRGRSLERPKSGGLFQNVRAIPTVRAIDPPPYACYNCWQDGHRHQSCPRPVREQFCINCGRRGTTVEVCPRCGEAYREARTPGVLAAVPGPSGIAATAAKVPSEGKAPAGSTVPLTKTQLRRLRRQRQKDLGGAARAKTTVAPKKGGPKRAQGPPGGVAAYIQGRIERAEAREAEGRRVAAEASQRVAAQEASIPDQGTQLRRPLSPRPSCSTLQDVAAASVVCGQESPASTDTESSISVVCVKREDSSAQEEEEEEASAADPWPPGPDRPSRSTRAVREWLALLRETRDISPETRRRVLRAAATQAAVERSQH